MSLNAIKDYIVEYHNRNYSDVIIESINNVVRITDKNADTYLADVTFSHWSTFNKERFTRRFIYYTSSKPDSNIFTFLNIETYLDLDTDDEIIYNLISEIIIPRLSRLNEFVNSQKDNYEQIN